MFGPVVNQLTLAQLVLRASCRQMELASAGNMAESHAYLLVSVSRSHTCSTVRSLQAHKLDWGCCRRSSGMPAHVPSGDLL